MWSVYRVFANRVYSAELYMIRLSFDMYAELYAYSRRVKAARAGWQEPNQTQ